MAEVKVEQQRRHVAVEAPCDLNPGYIFVAKIQGEQFLVTVPETGVKRGEIFEISLPTVGSCSNNNDHYHHHRTVMKKDTSRPQQQPGQWKDGLCSCFRFGIFHPSIWNAVCCPQVLMKQLSNRLSNDTTEASSSSDASTLNHNKCNECSLRSPTTTPTSSTPTSYKRGTTLFLLACLVDFLLVAPFLEATASASAMSHTSSSIQSQTTGTTHSDSSSTSAPFSTLSWGLNFLDTATTTTTTTSTTTSLGVQLFYAVWSITLTMLALWSVVQLRAAIRRKYNIPTTTTPCCCICGPCCEDVCCALCCHACTLSQLARQTANYDEEVASCCTSDGLAGSQRLNVCLFL